MEWDRNTKYILVLSHLPCRIWKQAGISKKSLPQLCKNADDFWDRVTVVPRLCIRVSAACSGVSGRGDTGSFNQIQVASVLRFGGGTGGGNAQLPGASQAAYGLEGSQALVKTLELGWVGGILGAQDCSFAFFKSLETFFDPNFFRLKVGLFLRAWSLWTIVAGEPGEVVGGEKSSQLLSSKACRTLLVPEVKDYGEVWSKHEPLPIPSMGLVYLPTFTIKINQM